MSLILIMSYDSFDEHTDTNTYIIVWLCDTINISNSNTSTVVVVVIVVTLTAVNNNMLSISIAIGITILLKVKYYLSITQSHQVTYSYSLFSKLLLHLVLQLQ